MKKIILGLFVIGIIMSACKKDSIDDPIIPIGPSGPDGTILTEVLYWTPSKDKAVKIAELTTDATGKITGINQFSTNGDATYKYETFEKNAAGKIIKVKGTSVFNGNLPIAIELFYTGTNITKVTNANAGVTRTNDYTYDSNNRITLIESYYNTDKTIRKTLTYTGTSVNPSAIKQEVFNNNQVTNTTYKYDDKNNPYLKADPILYYMGLADNNTHNVIEQNDGATTTIFTIEYNPSGYPISRKSTTDAGLKYKYK